MEKTKALLLTKFDQYSNRLFRIYETLKGCYYQNNDIEKSYDYSMLMMFILANEFDKNNLNINFKINDYLQDKKKAIHEFIYQSMIISSDSPQAFDKYTAKNINIQGLALGLQQASKINKVSSNLTQSIIRQLSENKDVSNDIKRYKSLLTKRDELLKIKTNEREVIIDTNNSLKNIDTQIDKLKNKIQTNYPEFKNNYSNQIIYPSLIQKAIDSDTAILHMSMTDTEFKTQW